MLNVLQTGPNAEAELARTLGDVLHRTGMCVHISLTKDRETGERAVSVLAMDQATGERNIATGHDWIAAATELGRELGIPFGSL